MGDIFIIVLCAAGTALVGYQTIRGYRRRLLIMRSRRIDWRVSPIEYAFIMITLAALSLVMLGSTVLMIYGTTHPEWRRAHAKHTEHMMPALFRT